MRIKFLLASLLGVSTFIYLLWPSTAQINPTLPQPGLEVEPVRKNSAIIVPVEIAFSDLTSLVDDLFPDGELLHSGRKQESKSLSYRYSVRRWGPTEFQVTDGALELIMPLRVDAVGRKDICLGIKRRGKCKGIKTHETGESTAYVDANALVAFLVTEDYQIEVATSVTQQLTNRPHLEMDLFGDAIRLSINIEGTVEDILAKQEGKVAKALDRLLAKQTAKLDLKRTLATHWDTIRAPIALKDEAWISLSPERILFKGIHQISEDKVALGFGFDGPTSLSLDKPALPASIPLPPVTMAFAPADFNLSVPLTSAFDALNQEAKRTLVGKTLVKDGHWLQVHDIALSGVTIVNEEGEPRSTLVAAIDFEAGKGIGPASGTDASGSMHLTFMPAIDAETRSLRVVDVAATAETLNLMDKVGAQWLNSKFTLELMAQLTFDYGREIDKWQPRLNAELNEGIAYKGFTIEGELSRVDIGGFYVSGARLEVYLEATGTVSAIAGPQLLTSIQR